MSAPAPDTCNVCGELARWRVQPGVRDFRLCDEDARTMIEAAFLDRVRVKASPLPLVAA